MDIKTEKSPIKAEKEKESESQKIILIRKLYFIYPIDIKEVSRLETLKQKLKQQEDKKSSPHKKKKLFK